MLKGRIYQSGIFVLETRDSGEEAEEAEVEVGSNTQNPVGASSM